MSCKEQIALFFFILENLKKHKKNWRNVCLQILNPDVVERRAVLFREEDGEASYQRDKNQILV